MQINNEQRSSEQMIEENVEPTPPGDQRNKPDRLPISDDFGYEWRAERCEDIADILEKCDKFALYQPQEETEHIIRLQRIL